MRWVVTVKQLPEKKGKARLVIMGYQAADLEDELLEAATPTPTHRAKLCVLQMAAHNGFELKKADVSGAFLQGREQQADRYVVPVNELADALGITRGKPERLRKHGYGLVMAPKEWVESLYDGMEARQGNVTRTTAACVGAVFESMIACWLDTKMKLVGQRFNGECTASGNGSSGNKDICQ